MTDGQKELIKLQAAEISRRATAAYAAGGIALPVSILSPSVSGTTATFTTVVAIGLFWIGNQCQKQAERKILELDRKDAVGDQVG